MQKLFIGGKWTEAKSGASLPVVDPSTGETYDAIGRGAAPDIDAAVKAARAAYDGPWGAMTATDRGLKNFSIDAASARCSRPAITPIAVSVGSIGNSRVMTPSS